MRTQHRGRAGDGAVGPHLRGPVQAGDDAMLRPVLIIEEPAQRQAGARAHVSGQRDKVDMLPVVKHLAVLSVVSLARCGQL